jgi:hypothetical protein
MEELMPDDPAFKAAINLNPHGVRIINGELLHIPGSQDDDSDYYEMFVEGGGTNFKENVDPCCDDLTTQLTKDELLQRLNGGDVLKNYKTFLNAVNAAS